MSLESPLGKVLGAGSAKAGAHHWIAQRMTAVAMVPLGLWFLFSMVALDHGTHSFVAAWVSQPQNGILLILLVLTLLYHSALGLQVIVEDYVHGALGYITLIAVKFLHVILAVAAVYSVIVTSLGAGQ
ncbi:MAG: succinate dehydrogenase, hydrophobic membrane anchor protein [Gammaproteobacteria bacterium]|nr:succinate dehydrogenase, hydrophobic membrane anchor protein [Gammaproteobacteria bacterium]